MKLEIKGAMLNVVSAYTQKLDARWHRESNSGSKLDEVVEKVPDGKRVRLEFTSMGMLEKEKKVARR